MKIRRILLAAVAIAAMAGGATLSAQPAAGQAAAGQPQVSKRLPVGLQLYSVRADLAKDFYGTLKAVKEMGYQGVEFYGEYYGHSPVEIKRWCAELGLIPFSNHVPFQQMVDDFDKVVEENTILGVQYLVFPYMDTPSRPGVNQERFKETVALIGECGRKAAAAGFQMLYHNHDFEFAKMADGSVGYYYIFSSNDRSALQNEVDVCWADYAGFDPAELLRRYAGDIPVVHLKDYHLEGRLSSDPYALIGTPAPASGSSPARSQNASGAKQAGSQQPARTEPPSTGRFEFRPLGQGQVDIPAVIQAAIDGGAQWLCVEQDEPSLGLSRFENVALSVSYLRSLGLL